MQDDERLREERKKAKKNKDKYVGMSSDSMGFRQVQHLQPQSPLLPIFVRLYHIS
jgi:hypothetical protein